MKKYIIIMISVLLLSSCMTDQERIDKVKFCNDSGHEARYPLFWDLQCSARKLKQDTSVMDCIREYTNWIDEKYNNPDIVTNLREDSYSNVADTCNSIFWTK